MPSFTDASMTSSNCPFCITGKTTKVLSINNASGTFAILRCDNCLTEYCPIDHSAIDEQEVQKHFFDEDLYTIANIEKVHRYWRSEAKRIKALGYTSGKILDIGCNTGEFLYCLGDGYQKHGIEIADIPADLAEQKGITVYRTPLEEANLPTASFDIITLYALIEHLSDPRTLMQEIGRILKPGGIVVIMTGDYRTWKARLLGKHWHMYIPPLHQFFFCRNALRTVAQEFALEEYSHYFSPGGMTFSKNRILNLLEKASLWQLFGLPILRLIPFYDHYYGYFRKK